MLNEDDLLRAYGVAAVIAETVSTVPVDSLWTTPRLPQPCEAGCPTLTLADQCHYHRGTRREAMTSSRLWELIVEGYAFLAVLGWAPTVAARASRAAGDGPRDHKLSALPAKPDPAGSSCGGRNDA